MGVKTHATVGHCIFVLSCASFISHINRVRNADLHLSSVQLRQKTKQKKGGGEAVEWGGGGGGGYR